MAEKMVKPKMKGRRPLMPLDKKSLPSASDMARSKANARSAVVSGLPNRTGPPAPTTPELDYQKKRREAYGRGENPDLTTKPYEKPPSNMEKMPTITPGYAPGKMISTKPTPTTRLTPKPLPSGQDLPMSISPPPYGTATKKVKRSSPRGLSGVKGKALLAELAKKKLKMRGQGG